jgi:hypothetical protein
MATRKSPDKFHVGQCVILATKKGSGWGAAYGEHGVVIAPRRYDVWSCGSLDGSHEDGKEPGWRYAVRTARGINHFAEDHLRAVYDGEKVSTWEKFARVTGLRLDKELVAIERKPSKRRAGKDEARHG